ncbi:hypothetical protein SLS64_009639 [Diaporthe eres]
MNSFQGPEEAFHYLIFAEEEGTLPASAWVVLRLALVKISMTHIMRPNRGQTDGHTNRELGLVTYWGTIVGCSAWVYHRNKSIFGEDADVYRPERSLVDESLDKEKEGARIKEMTGTMLQFGIGSRNCIGKNISLLEIYNGPARNVHALKWL